MKSPFPGMDPYLEARWPEVHARLIVYSSNQLNSQLPVDLQANIEENLTVHEDDEPTGRIRPDIHVGHDEPYPVEPSTRSAMALAEPHRIKLPPHPSRHLEIVDRDGRVVTAIEFLSPWNKVGSKNRQRYVRKQLDYMDAGVNLVEVDLMRQGEYVLAAPLEEIPDELLTPYRACVFRGISSGEVELYPIRLQDTLPNIPVPLRPNDRDAVLQLQPLLDECYRDGRHYRIDYRATTRPGFDEADAKWMDELLEPHRR